MQEEVEQRTVTLIVNTAKLTERELEKALSKLLAHMREERQHKSVKATPHNSPSAPPGKFVP